MATVNTIDITSLAGSEDFPVNYNDVMDCVETIASQRITNLLSANRLNDAFWFYDVTDGTVIEEAVIKMAEAQAFNKSLPTFAPNDPTLYTYYFNNWDTKQFKTTVRRNDIRKIIANKGIGLDGVITRILDTLTQGEGHYSFTCGRNLLFQAPAKDYSTILGGVPKNMKGVIYAARDMYQHLKTDNDDLTAKQYVSATPEEDIRIAFSDKLLNLIDVVELANVFNLSKEELMGKLVVVPASDLPADQRYKIMAYDLKAMGHGRRLYEYSQDIIGETLYTNHFLTTDDCWFFNGLFKAAELDCLEAATDALDDIVGTATEYTITVTLSHATGGNTATKIFKYQSYTNVITPATGYTTDGATVTALTMGGVDISSDAWDEDTGVIYIPSVTGNVVINITAAAE